MMLLPFLFLSLAVTATHTCAQDIESPVASLVVRCEVAGQKDTVVAGAQVHFFALVGGKYKEYGPYKTGEDGIARCRRPRGFKGDAFIVARLDGKRIGVTRIREVGRRKAARARDSRPAAPAKIVMVKARRLEGSIFVPAGIDPRTVLVEIEMLSVLDGVNIGMGGADFGSAFPRSDEWRGLSRTLQALMTTRPNEKGDFVFPEVPERARIYAVARGAGLAEGQWSNIGEGFQVRSYDDFEITMQPESAVRGRVLGPEGKALAGVRVIARILPQDGFSRLSTFRTTSAADGSFRIGGMPAAKLVVSFEHAKFVSSPIRVETVSKAEVDGCDARLVLPVMLRVRVRDADGRALAGARIAAKTMRVGDPLGDGLSSADGLLELRLPPGRCQLYFTHVPRGFAYPTGGATRWVEVARESNEIVEFSLRPKSPR